MSNEFVVVVVYDFFIEGFVEVVCDKFWSYFEDDVWDC